MLKKPWAPFGTLIQLFCFIQGRCQKGWVTFQESCYFFETKRKANWHAAWEECVSMDARVIKIESEIENNFITAELQRLDPGLEQYLTAGNDLDAENVWVWADMIDGTVAITNVEVIGYTNWARDEPNDYDGNEDCLVIYPELDNNWNDIPCEMLFHFICEKPE